MNYYLIDYAGIYLTGFALVKADSEIEAKTIFAGQTDAEIHEVQLIDPTDQFIDIFDGDY